MLPRPLARFEGPTSKGGEGRGEKRGGNERGGEGEEGRGGKRGGEGRGRRRREGRGLSGNVAEEAFCLKSPPLRLGLVLVMSIASLLGYERKIVPVLYICPSRTENNTEPWPLTRHKKSPCLHFTPDPQFIGYIHNVSTCQLSTASTRPL